MKSKRPEDIPTKLAPLRASNPIPTKLGRYPKKMRKEKRKRKKIKKAGNSGDYNDLSP